jgi:hypothetical protein
MRDDSNNLLLALLVGGVAYWWWKNQAPGATLTDTATATYDYLANEGNIVMNGQTRGERNNNPGNIKISGNQWEGLAEVQSDPVFAVFTSPEYGIRAIGKLLTNYYQNYGLNTVQGLITRWSSTDQAAYVQNVAMALGVTPTTVIDVTDPNTLQSLVAAIIQQENGRDIYLASGQLASGLALA